MLIGFYCCSWGHEQWRDISLMICENTKVTSNKFRESLKISNYNSTIARVPTSNSQKKKNSLGKLI
ncbi:MAG: hypothetical protein COZ18_09900 [Flexibacter sp. CG_4_10_14_3_um_filter_32_15]|nr:MAG: hypothetical protein COZ18_09900 [Flexibacter sp. CG_4_10_14_3_um_filter_32_15]